MISKAAKIEDYALIGDCHGSALVSRWASIEWCCLGRFDKDPVFFKMLDHKKGGYFSVELEGLEAADRQYVDRTNILTTQLASREATLEVEDFMPVGRSHEAGTYNYVDLHAPSWIIRTIKAVKGRPKIKIQYKPSSHFGREKVFLSKRKKFVSTASGPFLYSDVIDSFYIRDDLATAELELAENESLSFVLTENPVLNIDVIAKVAEMRETTEAFWTEWAEFCRYTGAYRSHVLRSALVLKALTYAPTGAVIAAPTTSLPEIIGGERNFDYRYCWIRDASFTLYALSSLGYSGEADQFANYVHGCCALTYPMLSVVYGIGGETDLNECTHSHLIGYKGSQPVRTGNEAYRQNQLDIFGSMQEGFEISYKLGKNFRAKDVAIIENIADLVVKHWQKKDHGIWEARSEPLHYVYSKVMCWVALDRAARFGSKNTEVYAAEAKKVLKSIIDHGIDDETKTLKRAYGDPSADASLLRVVSTGIPLDREILKNTVLRIEDELSAGHLVFRYKSEDGFSGDEGTFMTCSFWMVNALLHVGEYERAKQKFEWLLEQTNDVGLMAEELSQDDHSFLGNFPQGLSHLALIESAVNLEVYERKGLSALSGTLAEQVDATVGSSRGIAGILAAYHQTGRIGRVFSSPHSKLHPLNGELN